MYDDFKYIVKRIDGREEFFPFRPSVNHSDITHKSNVISAGFVRLSKHTDYYTLFCYGDSVSMGIKSRPIEDTELACLFFQNLLIEETVFCDNGAITKLLKSS